MEYILIPAVALLASLLTFFSGFGLGTILTPAFALFFPIETAIALTAFVHFTNNIFKLFLVYKNIDFKILLKFGSVALLSSLLGAYLLKNLSASSQISHINFTLLNHTFETSVLKIVVGILLIFFSLIELIPILEKKFNFSEKHIYLGGFLSGFFGGLTGNQGAFRSAVLIKFNLDKFRFIATGTAIACLIDTARISIYMENFTKLSMTEYQFIAYAAIPAMLGAFIGTKVLKKTEIHQLKLLVGIFLMIFSILLAFGII